MRTVHRAVAPLKVFLVLLFGILVVFQTLSLPGKFAYMATRSPAHADERWPLTALAAFWILCVQIVIVSTWKLLTLVQKDRIFSDASTVWVSAILWAIVAAWVVLMGVFVFVLTQADDPGAPMLLLLVSILVTALGLLMLIMRELLRQATRLRDDMESMI